MPVWLEAARRGEVVASPEEGLTWKEIGLLNARIYNRHRDRSLDDALAYFRDTHRRFMEMVAAMPEEEMRERGRYPYQASACPWISTNRQHSPCVQVSRSAVHRFAPSS